MELEHIVQMINDQGASWAAEENPISLLPPDEQLKRLGYVPGPGEPSLTERECLSRANLPGHSACLSEAGRPAAFDLRNVGEKNFVTSVKDQGGCGSCVSFGTCATVEATVRVSRQDPSFNIDLSEAQLFYCIARSEGRTCQNGWWVQPALDAFQSSGIADEACYPYTAGDQNCSNLCSDWASRVTKIKSYTTLTSVEDMKQWLATKGALASCFTVYNDFFSYRSGIYRHVTGDFAGGHCISVVGYDDTAQCWICKNSWGTGWGDNGYFRIAYGECGIDSAMWGVEVEAPSTTVPLYRYWNTGAGDHFYTTNWEELGAGKYGWVLEGVQCYVYPGQIAGTVPLYRYWNSQIADHFYTTNWNELGPGRYGWNYERIQCYVYPAPVAGAVPLYRYWNTQIGDHFYTTNWNELAFGKYGWSYEGIQCYVGTRPLSISVESASETTDIPATFTIMGSAAPATVMPAGPRSFTCEEVQPATFTTSAEQSSVPATFTSSTATGSAGAATKVEITIKTA